MRAKAIGKPGFAPFGDAPGWGTVVVCGVARGGTTMMAGLLARLGVDIGTDVEPANQEDRRFLIHGGVRDLFSGGAGPIGREAYLREIRAYVAARNRGGRWGWKDPIVSAYLADIVEDLRAPAFILVTRDAAAVSERESLEDAVNDGAGLYLGYAQRALDEYRTLTGLLAAWRRPTLVVSYERALRWPGRTVEAVAGFLRLAPSPAQAAQAAAYILPDRRTGEEVAALPPGLQPEETASWLNGRFLAEIDAELVAARLAQAPSAEPPFEPAHAAAEIAQLSRLLGAGRFDEAVGRGRAALGRAARTAPAAGLPIHALLVACAAGSLDEASTLPDHLLPIHYCIGMALLNSARPAGAIDRFALVYHTAKALLYRRVPRSDSARDLIWPARFHQAYAARMLGNLAAMHAILDEMAIKAGSDLWRFSPTGQALKVHLERADRELR